MDIDDIGHKIRHADIYACNMETPLSHSKNMDESKTVLRDPATDPLHKRDVTTY